MILNLVIDNNNIFNEVKTDQKNLKYFLEFHEIEQYRFCELNDVHQKKDEKFLHICINESYLSSFIENHNRLPLSDSIINTLQKCDNFFVLFILESEADKSHLLKVLENKILEINLKPEQFYVMTGNESLIDIKRKNNFKINVGVTDRLIKGYSKQLSLYNCDFKEEKKYFFLCFNRRFHKHRFATLCYLKKFNLLDDTNWSFLRGNVFKNTYSSNINAFHDILDVSDFQDEMLYIGNQEIKKADFEESYKIDINDFELDYQLSFKLNTYSESYVNITTESKFLIEDVIHITEKTLFPFYFLQLPIIVSSYNHIKKTKERLDLDFFDDLINHDYDNEPNHKERIRKVMLEVKRLHDNKEFVKDFYKKNRHRLEKNKERVMNFKYEKNNHNYIMNIVK